MEQVKPKIFYFGGTHWDREWYQSFQGFRYRLVKMVGRLLEGLAKHTEYKVFHFDGQTIVLDDFMDILPEKRDELVNYISQGRIVIGPWYVMPDEFLLSGESLIKNLMVGHSKAESWGTKPWNVGYICDIFGHIAQMPQIFCGFGIRYALLGRGTNEFELPAYFIWEAPDGSRCLTYKVMDRSGYGSFMIDVMGQRNDTSIHEKDSITKLKEYMEYERRRCNIPIWVVMDGMDHAEPHFQWMEYCDAIKELYPEAEVIMDNLHKAFTEAEAYKGDLPVKTGELNRTGCDPGGYNFLISHTLSSRYPIKASNDVCQTLLEKWVEPLAAVSELEGYAVPRAYIELAYRYLLQNHPHDSICGCSIDQVHKDMEYRFNQVSEISNGIIADIVYRDSSKICNFGSNEAFKFRVWNPLPYERTEVITTEMAFNPTYSAKFQEPFGYELKNGFKIFDGHNHEIPYGLTAIKRGSIKKTPDYQAEIVDIHRLSFQVKVPAMGYSEYRVVPWYTPVRYLNVLSLCENEAENEFLRLRVNANGTISIFDKLSGKHYDNLLSYSDDGEIGDGWFHVNPVEDRCVSSYGQGCTIEIVENGPKRIVFRVSAVLSVPECTVYTHEGKKRSEKKSRLEIVSLVGLSSGAKFVDVRTTVKNCIRDHRLRLKIPTGIVSEKYRVNQPFAFVERRVGIDRQTSEWKECDVPEKQMSGIVYKQDVEGRGIGFVSSFGLHECAAMEDMEGSIYITLLRAFRKTVMTDGEEGGQIQGDLHYEYCLAIIDPTTGPADLTRLQDMRSTGFRYSYHKDSAGCVSKGYFELSNGDICMSLLKKAEGMEGEIVVRFYNLSDQPSCAFFKSFWEISGVTKITLNEEPILPVSYIYNGFTVELGPWEIGSYRITFNGEITREYPLE